MKSKMKKHGIQWIAFMLVVIMMFMLAACGNKDQSQNPEPVESNAQTEPVTGPVGNTDAESKILVIYFSWSGNLHKMAGWVADETGGDLIRVTAKEAYPDDYDATADRAKQEQEDGVRPEINVDLTAEQLAQRRTHVLALVEQDERTVFELGQIETALLELAVHRV